MFKKILLSLLLLTIAFNAQAQSASTTIEASFVRATISYTELTGSYAVLLANTRKLTKCTFVNSTNAAISWANGSNVAISDNQGALSKEYEDFGSNARHVSTDIKVKYTVGAPTIGNVYINCYY